MPPVRPFLPTRSLLTGASPSAKQFLGGFLVQAQIFGELIEWKKFLIQQKARFQVSEEASIGSFEEQSAGSRYMRILSVGWLHFGFKQAWQGGNHNDGDQDLVFSVLLHYNRYHEG